MYEEVREAKPKTKNNLRLWLILSGCVLFLGLVTALIIGSYAYYASFRGFMSDFSEATNLNYRKGEVLVTTAEEEFYLSKENTYFVYNVIVNAGRGRLGEAPTREPDAVLDYKFGGKLELWDIDLKSGEANQKRGLFIAFTNKEGEVYAYDTDRLVLERLPLKAWKNE